MNFDETTALQTVQGSEIETSAMAAGATMEIQAMMAWAVKYPRDEDKALDAMLKRAQSEKFADLAIYEMERKNWRTGEIKVIRGLTIECARDLLVQWKNTRIVDSVIADTERYLIGKVCAYDIENNVQIPEEFIVSKTWERSKIKEGDELCGERINTNGQKIYIIKIPDLELNNAYKAQRARSLRNVINAIIPSYYKEQILEACMATKRNASEKAVQSNEGLKAMALAFAELDVSEDQLIKYLGHPIAKMTAKEHVHLRGVYRSMKNEGIPWERIVEMAGKAKAKPESGALNLNNMQPGTPEKQEDKSSGKRRGRPPGSKNKPKESSAIPSEELPTERTKTTPATPPVDQDQDTTPPDESNASQESDQLASSGKMGADDIRKVKLAEVDEILREHLKLKWSITDDGRIKAARNCVKLAVMATEYEEMTIDDIEEAILYITQGTRFEEDLRERMILLKS